MTAKKFPVSIVSKEVIAEMDARLGEKGNRSGMINDILENWFTLMRQAKNKMFYLFSDKEKGLILDATDGYHMEGLVNAALIYATVEDGIVTEALDEKWGIESDFRLVTKLKELSPVESLALAEAIKDWRAAWNENPDNTKYGDLLKTETRKLIP